MSSSILYPGEMTFKLSKRLILLQNRLREHITGDAHFFWFPDSVIKFTKGELK